MTLFYPNLSFEDDLAASPSKATAASLKALSELAPLMAWAGDENSICVVPELPDGLPKCCVGRCVDSLESVSLGDSTLLQPWGWTKAAMQFADSNPSVQHAAPDLGAVRTVNGRAFLNRFDEAVSLSDGRRYQFSKLCTSLEQVIEAVRQFQSSGWTKWVAKPELSHAGRNRLIVTGTAFNNQQTGWLKRRLGQGRAVCVEPWVTVEHEGSLHFEIPAQEDAAVQEIGITGLLNDGAGRYRGSVFPIQMDVVDTSGDLIQLLFNHGRIICGAMRQTGYWGPVGLDFLVYKDPSGQPFLRLCNDLNARWTMGRLSLRVADRVGADVAFRWEHFVSGNSAILDRAIEKGLAETGMPSVDILRTSPDHVAGRDVRLGNVAIWDRTSSDSGCQSVAKVAQQIRLSLQELLFEKSSQ